MATFDPLIGKKLGDYTIVGLLGRGGMSRVYRGYDENLDRYAAVKVISGDFATTSEEEYTRRFQIEARAIARLRHPNIVGVYQFGRTEGIYYMAMVFMEGLDLRSVLKDYAMRGQRMPIAEVLRIARDIASALDYAHSQGVIHRDVKPSNIILEQTTGRAVLMDFGLALSVHEGTTGDTFGSAHYIAPEQAVSSANAVPQSDLYSLGIVIYEMIAGKVPFDDPSAMSVALKHLNELPPPITLYNPDLPSTAESVIMRALEKDPTKRYSSGQMLLAALDQAFEHTAIAPSPAPVKSEPVYAHEPPTDTEQVPSRPSSKPSAIAQRFAQHREQREQEHLEDHLSESDLRIDAQALDSILDSYADPREIGLVDPNAPSVRRSTARQAEAEAARKKKARARRRRIAMLLVLILIAGGAAGAYYVLNQDKDDKDGGETVALSSDDKTATADWIASNLTEEAAATLPSPTETSGPSATPTDRPTLGPSPLPVSSQTTAPEITEESTEEPTVTLTKTATTTPSLTPTATPSPTKTFTATPSLTHTPTGTPTPTATPTPPIEGQEPNLALRYNANEVLLINLTRQQLDVSVLVFEQERRDGTLRSFEASLWPGAGIMEPLSCYQLLQTEATRIRPDANICPVLMGWFRANVADRYFWIADADEPGAVFTVRLAGNSSAEPIATCAVTAGECLFYMPLPE